jgi:hypothetical protein
LAIAAATQPEHVALAIRTVYGPPLNTRCTTLERPATARISTSHAQITSDELRGEAETDVAELPTADWVDDEVSH